MGLAIWNTEALMEAMVGPHLCRFTCRIAHVLRGVYVRILLPAPPIQLVLTRNKWLRKL